MSRKLGCASAHHPQGPPLRGGLFTPSSLVRVPLSHSSAPLACWQSVSKEEIASLDFFPAAASNETKALREGELSTAFDDMRRELITSTAINEQDWGGTQEGAYSCRAWPDLSGHALT